MRVVAGDGQSWIVDDTGGAVAALLVSEDRHDEGSTLAIGVQIVARGLVDRAESSATLDALVQRAVAGCHTTLRIECRDNLVRYVARGRGFTGQLRAPLEVHLGSGDGPAPVVAPMDERRLEAAVTALVGPTRVVVLEPARWSARRRRFHLLDFVVTDPAFRKDLVVRVPSRADSMPEAIASAVDTAAAVLRRFPVEVHRVSFEKATWGLETDRHAGVADPGVGMVYLHPGYVLAEERERALYERRAELPSDPSLMVAEPYASVDETVAHELWHRIEAASHGPRAFGGVEFHRQVGEALGVDTLEHALRGGAPGAPEAWRVAHQRLVREVSAYAATDPREAKAEMFKRWWSHRDDPSPVVARFGELVESYFDAG